MAGVIVVVPEDADDRYGDSFELRCEGFGFGGLSAGRHISCDEEQIRLLGEFSEVRAERVRGVDAEVHVAHRRDSHAHESGSTSLIGAREVTLTSLEIS